MRVSEPYGDCVGLLISQRGDSPFVYRDRAGWPHTIGVSMAIGTQSGIRLHKKVHMVKIWGYQPKSHNGKIVKIVKVHFNYSSSSCCCCSSVSTHVSQKLYRVKKQNFAH